MVEPPKVEHRMFYDIQLDVYRCIDCDLRLNVTHDNHDSGFAACDRDVRAAYRRLYMSSHLQGQQP